MQMACCGQIPLKEGDVLQAQTLIESCAHEVGFTDVSFVSYNASLDLIGAITDTKSDNPPDIAICGQGASGLSSLQLARDIRETAPHIPIVVCAATAAEAVEALRLNADGVIAVPAAADDVTFTFSRVFRDLFECYSCAITLHLREGVRHISPSRLLYVETVNHDQVLHLSDGSTYSLRIASKAFFDLISHTGEFFKSGSSFILNIRKIRSIDPHASTAKLIDGTIVPVPGRLRKSLESAVLENAHAASA